MTTIAVNGRIHQAERNSFRQPLIASKNNPIAASGSSIPTGPLPKHRHADAGVGRDGVGQGKSEEGIRDWGLGIRDVPSPIPHSWPTGP